MPNDERAVSYQQSGNTTGNSNDEVITQDDTTLSLRFFDALEVPRINPADCPPNVSGVHFTADLSNAQHLTVEVLSGRGGLFSAAAPGS